MDINIPEQVDYIINTLEQCGYEAYIVGGCVRDSLLGKEPHDYDITTNALPEQTMSCFTSFNIIETGIKHGTITIIIDDQPFEITTYRVDGEYSDNRHPNEVKFVSNLKDDLSRRDFTINAMAYNTSKGLVDYFEGQKDLKNGKVKCVGDANKRFQEDALRIMRALRFVSTLNFSIEENTSKAIYDNKDLLKNISVERISSELNKLIVAENATEIMLSYTFIFEVFIPEIKNMIGFEQHNKYHYLDVWKHTLCAINNSPKEVILRLALLFHDIAKPLCYTIEEYDDVYHFNGHPQISSDMSIEILKRLKYDNDTINKVSKLIFYHDAEILPKRQVIKRWLNKVGYDMFYDLIKIKRADINAQSYEYKNKRLVDLDKILIIVNEIKEEQQCFSLKDLMINGKDLMNIGIKEGKEIGNILNKLLQLVINEDIPNDKEKLLIYVQKENYNDDII